MSFNLYGLDESARKLIKNQIEREKEKLEAKDINILIKESHKMRQAVAYGLERFWGEQLRLQSDSKPLDSAKGEFWRDTWNEFVNILSVGDVKLPNHQDIDKMADKLWSLSREDQQIALAVLTQFCDSLVWWTQRYKLKV